MIGRFLCRVGIHWWSEEPPRLGWRVWRCARKDCTQRRWVRDDD